MTLALEAPADSRLTPICVVPLGELAGEMTMWLCRCSCGNEIRVRACRVRNGATRSCGCLAAEMLGTRSRTHGHSHSKSPTYQAWCNARQRCSDPTDIRYPTYGARGITVCDRWLGKHGFGNFLADMGERPPGMSIDRRDNDRGYDPDNCRWATRLEQARNKTSTKLNEVSVAMIRHLHRRGASFTALGHAFGVTGTSVANVVKRKTWR